MNDISTQNTRRARLATKSMGDKLLLVDFTGSEGINSLFEFRITVMSDEFIVDRHALIGQYASITADTIGGGKRYFSGTVTGFQTLASGGTGHRYELTVRPAMWFLGKRHTSRIFHEMTVVEILNHVFAEYGEFGMKVETRLYHSYDQMEYTVQYRETDLNFVCRLMEHWGINYFFVMGDKEHTLVLSDTNEGFEFVPGQERKFRRARRAHGDPQEHLDHFSHHRQYYTPTVRTRAYDFKQPGAGDIRGKTQMDAIGEIADLEIYDHYHGSENSPSPTRPLDAMFHAQTVRHDMFAGNGDAMSFYAGGRVRLSGNAQRNYDNTYVLIACQHEYIAESYGSGETESSGESYNGTYSFAPIDRTFAPDRVTPKGVIRGPLTAVVIGEGEIDCDKFGRILVMFHWDTKDTGTMRCRVAQPWAGNGWGSVFIPRVGMEVVVEFLDGNPDSPMVTGAVYNGTNMPPFALPANKTKSGIKSRSSEGGGGYNMMVFEDKKGSELVDIHAQRDLHVKVLRNERRNIGGNFSETIGGTQAITVGKDASLEVGGSRSTTIGESDSLIVADTLEIEAGSRIVLKVGGSTIEMDSSGITLSSNDITLDAGMTIETKAGLKAKHTAGVNLTIQAAIVKIN